MGINNWLEDELYQQYLRDPNAVDEAWRRRFEQSPPASAPPPAAGPEVAPLRGAAARIAENMAASLTVPLATSQRTIAVKVMDENRRMSSAQPRSQDISQELIKFDNFNRSTNDQASHVGRFEILQDRFSKYVKLAGRSAG